MQEKWGHEARGTGIWRCTYLCLEEAHKLLLAKAPGSTLITVCAPTYSAVLHCIRCM